MREQMKNEALLVAVADGTATREEAERARELLKGSRHWRKVYLEHARLHHLLCEKYEGSQPVLKVAGFERRWWQSRELKAVAALLLVSAVVAGLFWKGQEPESTLVKFGPESFGRIEHVEGLSGKGKMFEGSRMVLKRGAVSLTFPSGVEALIEGPAVATMTGRNALHLEEGRGYFEVPDGAEGFVCTTNSLFVEDLGTAFGVVADEMEEVHVKEGKVRFRPISEEGAQLQTLKAGERLGWMDSALTLSIPERDFASGFAGRVTVLADDFSEPDGTPLQGKGVDVGEGTWDVTKGNPVIRNNRLDTSGAFRKAAFIPLKSELNELSHVLLLTVEAETADETLYAPGWAGVSLYTGDQERIFIGDPTGAGVSWGLHPVGWQLQNAIPKADGKRIVTLRYDYRTGLTELFEGESTTSEPLASEWIAPGLVFDRLRIANGSAFEGALDVGASPETIERTENMDVRGDIAIRSLRVDILRSEAGVEE